MKRASKKSLKEIQERVDEARGDLFALLHNLHRDEEITTKQYIDACTATYDMMDAFNILKEDNKK